MKFRMLLTLVCLFACGFSFSQSPRNQSHPILKFMQDHPDRYAIQMKRNDTIIVTHNNEKIIPLASTVKIIIAIEYAVQAAEGQINADELIALDELDKFYVPYTDGGAHPSWSAYSKPMIKNDSIPLREVAKGMIMFSSNANTEWLCQKLGFDKVNYRLKKLGIKKHTSIFPIVSSLFVGKEGFPGVEGQELITKLDVMSPQDYERTCYVIHKKLKTNPEYKSDLGDLSMPVQKVWSTRLPASTTKEYVQLMEKLNSKSFFDSTVHLYLDEVMEGLMQNPANQKWLKHAGMKGGSTSFVLTKASYATDKEGNKTELAYFLFNLDPTETMMLQQQMNGFEYSLLINEGFRERLKSIQN